MIIETIWKINVKNINLITQSYQHHHRDARFHTSLYYGTTTLSTPGPPAHVPHHTHQLHQILVVKNGRAETPTSQPLHNSSS